LFFCRKPKTPKENKAGKKPQNWGLGFAEDVGKLERTTTKPGDADAKEFVADRSVSLYIYIYKLTRPH
jgi:hypothetical protein